MMPNMDPRTMKNMLAKMGIKTEEIDALRVVIECSDKTITIDNPQITQISSQGSVSFQIGGEIHEAAKKITMEVTDDDVKLVMENTGVKDEQKVREALQNANGDIAAAIVALK